MKLPLLHDAPSADIGLNPRLSAMTWVARTCANKQDIAWVDAPEMA